MPHHNSSKHVKVLSRDQKKQRTSDKTHKAVQCRKQSVLGDSKFLDMRNGHARTSRPFFNLSLTDLFPLCILNLTRFLLTAVILKSLSSCQIRIIPKS